MFDLNCSLSSLFGNMTSYYESISEVICSLQGNTLPSTNDILTFQSSVPASDSLLIVISDISNECIRINKSTVWEDEYQTYTSHHEPDDKYKIEVSIDKKHTKESGTNIYSTTHFLHTLSELTTSKVLYQFSTLFKNNEEYLRFTVLDETLSLYTNNIAFCSPSDKWPIGRTNRIHSIKRCEDASTYLDIHKIRLIPQDFRIIESHNADSLANIFLKLEALLSYAYVSTSSFFKNDCLVFYIEPGIATEVDLDTYQPNGSISSIYHWAFDSDSAMERVSIARNLLKLYCRLPEQILNINESIFLSIKSNYFIYQKDTTEKYIELKESITSFIVSITEHTQDLAHELAHGFRNNFVAIITFLITVLLTNSLTDDKLFIDVLPKNLVFVSYLFIAVSACYFIVSVVSVVFKWSFIRLNYNRLKDNYKELFDKNDLERAFDNDSFYIETKNRIVKYTVGISILWFLFILAMVIIVTCFSEGNSNILPGILDSATGNQIC